MPPTPPSPPGPPIAVVGAGAVGSYFAALLAQAGRQVTLIGRAAQVQAVQALGLRLRRGDAEHTVAVAASTEAAAVRGAGLVLVCVKSGDTASVAVQLAPWLAPTAQVLSLQNGVHNGTVLAQGLGRPVMAAGVYAAVAQPEPGLVQHHGGGQLVLGPVEAGSLPPATLQAVAALFEHAGVPVRLVPDVMPELWAKLVVNCACNAVSALGQANYAQMAALPAVVALQEAAVREAVAVAQAEGQALALEVLLAAVARIATTMPAQRSSTAQDLARGRPSEIDHLNGHIVRRGAALGIATPVNHTLWTLVKLAEAGAARP